MKINQIVFSPTGGTLKAADILTAKLGNDINRIDLTDSKCNFSALNSKVGNLAVIAVPSYGGRVPALAAERLSQIKGNNAICVLVCVYGNRDYDDTLVELKDIAEKSGFKVIAAVAAVAEHSIVRQYAAGRPDSKDEAELQGFAEKISEKIKKGIDRNDDLKMQGNRPYKKAEREGLFPKQTASVQAAAYVQKNAPHRQSAEMT